MTTKQIISFDLGQTISDDPDLFKTLMIELQARNCEILINTALDHSPCVPTRNRADFSRGRLFQLGVYEGIHYQHIATVANPGGEATGKLKGAVIQEYGAVAHIDDQWDVLHGITSPNVRKVHYCSNPYAVSDWPHWMDLLLGRTPGCCAPFVGLKGRGISWYSSVP